ncbi:TPA: DUF262 domain-containing protein [Streptococcus suis]
MSIELFNVFSVEKEREAKKENNTDTQEIIDKLKSGEYNLVIDQARYPLAALSVIFASYDLHPDYQRNKVWDNQRKSKLIESLIMNIPIPPVFLYEVSPSKYEVMDGLQRISTIIDFFNNKFSLEGLEVWSELNGTLYKNLIPEIRDAINSRYLSGSVILNDSRNNKDKQHELKRIVFERLNTGGIQLTKQEIRNALNTGYMNSMINKFADENEVFNNLWSLGNSKNSRKSSKKPVDRMEKREMILRFFTYKDLLYNNVSMGTLQALDYYSSKSVDFSKEKVYSLESYLKDTLILVESLFGNQAFSKKSNTKSEKMIFDTVMLACSKLLDDGEVVNSIRSIESNIELKNLFIEKDKKIFNGKYTALSNVKERQEKFYDFLKSEIINGSQTK